MKTIRAGFVAALTASLLACGGGSHSGGWVRDVSDVATSAGLGVAAFSDGTSVLVGAFEGTAVFGLGEGNQTTLTSDGQQDGFVARYAGDGHLLWARRLGGTAFDQATGAGRVDDGTCLVTGQYTGTATFGPGEANETVLVAAGPADMDAFVARYAANGDLIWARRVGGSGSAVGEGVAAIGSGSLVVTGNFDGSAVFGPGQPGETTLTSAGLQDVFVAEYDHDGNLAWARQAGGGADDMGRSVATFADGTFVVTGLFTTKATFGPGEAGQTLMLGTGAYDLFVARYGTDGSLTWVTGAPGAAWAAGGGVAGFSDGTCVVTGDFGGDATFGSGEIGETTLTSDGAEDFFVARFAADGTLAWARRGGGADHDHGNGIDVLPGGACVVTGSFQTLATFGPGQPNQVTFTSTSTGDVFVARYDANGNLDWAHEVDVSVNGGGTGVSAFPDASFVVSGIYGTSATFAPGGSGETTLTAAGPMAAFLARYLPDGGF